jgi:3-oxoacyl-[acyl-carrier protein] reductase
MSLKLETRYRQLQMFVANKPLGRRSQPEDIAKAAVLLASDDAAWITGEQI